MPKPGHIPFVVPDTNKIVQVPEAEISVAEAEGYRPASADEEKAYYAEKEYAETSGVSRQAKGFALGAASQLAAIPALAADLTGIDEGASGHKWVADFMSTLDPEMSPGEAQERLRIVAKHGAAGHFGGEIVGMAAGAKGLGGLSKAGLKAVGKEATKGVAKAGATAESVATHMSLANEQMFVDNQETTPELLMMAAAFGGVGPLVLSPAMGAIGKVAEKGARKLDAHRLKNFKKAFGKDAAAEASAAEAPVAAAAMSADDVAKELAKAKSRVKMIGDQVKDDLRMVKDAAKSGRQIDPKRLEMVESVKANLDKAKADVARYSSPQPAASPAAPGPRPAQPRPVAAARPAKFSDIFTKEKRSGAVGDLLEESAGKAEGASKFFKSLGNTADWRTARHMQRPLIQHGFGGGGGAMLGGFIGGDLLGVISGGAVGIAVQLFGPKAAGWALRHTADGFRAMSRRAIQANRNGVQRAVAPRDFLMPLGAEVGRSVYRSRIKALMEESTAMVDQTVANPRTFAEQVGDTFGELDEVAPGVTIGATKQYLKAFSYLKGEMPPQPLVYPGMPQMGTREVPLQDMESYLRKVRAVTNPLAIVEDIANGHVHRDTIEAMENVYPSMMLDIKSELLDELSQATEPLTRQQAAVFDKILGGRGALYRPNNPGFQGRLGILAEEEQQKRMAQGPQGSKPGRASGNPSMAQQMKTGSQKAMESIGN